MYAIEVKDLVKSYGGITAVKGITFTVNEGEVFGLIGPNGAGKTTTLRILATLLQITSGSIKVFGHDLDHARPTRSGRSSATFRRMPGPTRT